MSIGSNIAAARLARGLTLERLAERVNVPPRTIGEWENDERLPEIKDLPALAAALRVSIDALLDEGREDPQLLSPNFDAERMYEQVKAGVTQLGLTQASAALPFMRRKHAGQYRKGMVDTAPYYIHPLTLARHALAMGITDDDVIASLLLHDVIEDTETMPEELPVNDRVRNIVCLVSYNTYTEGESGPADKKRIKPEYYRHIAEEPPAALVKCVDRCNNLSCMADGFTRRRMKEYVAETENYIVPLLDVIETVPEWKNAAWLLRYQIHVLLETFKRLL